MPSRRSRDFNSDDQNSAATYGKLRQKIQYRTKGPIRERGNTTTHDCESLMQIPRILCAYQIQANASTFTRTLRDVKFQKGWHFIWASSLATYKNKTMRSKAAQNTLHGKCSSIWASPFAANKNKTSNLMIDLALPQDAQPTCNQPTSPSSTPSSPHQY